MLPNDLLGFERHGSIEMVGDDAGSIVGCAISNPLIAVWETCLQDGDAEASHGELPQEVNYGSRARSCYTREILIL